MSVVSAPFAAPKAGMEENDVIQRIIAELSSAGYTKNAACEEAADRYIAWMTDPAEASWMRTRLIFARDSQVRQAVAAKRVSLLGERFGAVGRDLAKAMNGRLDMQGHNMMQEQVAFGDDADDGRD